MASVVARVGAGGYMEVGFARVGAPGRGWAGPVGSVGSVGSVGRVRSSGCDGRVRGQARPLRAAAPGGHASARLGAARGRWQARGRCAQLGWGARHGSAEAWHPGGNGWRRVRAGRAPDMAPCTGGVPGRGVAPRASRRTASLREESLREESLREERLREERLREERLREDRALRVYGGRGEARAFTGGRASRPQALSTANPQAVDE